MKSLTLLLVTLAFSLSAQPTVPSLSSPPQTLSILGEGFISTSINERDFALSPDGSELYFTISGPRTSASFQTIVYCRKTTDGWTSPEVVSFAGEYSDLEPAFSFDGQTLYFASNRPTTGSGAKDFDIWKVTRADSGWGNPENLGPVINTEEDEFYPSITKSGNLYYTAAYKGGPGREDIYMATRVNNQYQKAVALDTAVNTKYYEFNAFVDPNEKFILFTSYGRKDDTGGGDLYMAVKGSDGKWKSSVPLKDINSKQLDYCPYVSPDGKSLFFTSERHQLPASFVASKATYEKVLALYKNAINGTGNIYWLSFEQLLKSNSSN